MALSGNGSRVSCGLTGRSLENRPLAASWPPMRDGLNGPMDENQLWFVETVSQSVSSRGPRRSAHHRLNGHTDGFAQLSNRNSRIRTIGASSLFFIPRCAEDSVSLSPYGVPLTYRRPLIDLDRRERSEKQ